MKKIILTQAFLFLTIGTFLIANEDSSDHHNRYNPEPDQSSTHKNSTLPAGPQLSQGLNIYISADYIYWKASTGSESLVQGLSKTTMKIGQEVVVQDTGITNPGLSYPWDSGFKVGLATNIGHDGWSASAEYTWLRPEASKSITANPRIGLRPSGISLLGSEIVSKGTISATEQLYFNNIILALGRKYYVSEFFSFNPFTGLYGTWNRVKTYKNASNLEINGVTHDAPGLFNLPHTGSTPYSIVNATTSKNIQIDAWGVGILVGIELDMYLFKQLCIFGKLQGSGVFQSSKRTVESETIGTLLFSQTDRGDLVINDDAANSRYTLTQWICYNLGLRYNTYFNTDKYYLSLEAKWETQYTKLYKKILSAGGLVIKAEWGF